MSIAAWVFWICGAGLLYIYLGYPVLVWALATLRPRPVRKAPFSGRVSVVVVAYNEETSVERKIRSLLTSDNAAQMGEIIVASDGSTDGTVEKVGGLGDSRIHVRAFTERRGKPAVLNDVVPECAHPVVVLTDARQEVEAGSLSVLLSNFADPAVGVVSGELVFRRRENATVTARGIDFYWRYEKFIRKHEARFASVPGATGALYAIRKELFAPIPAECLLDDVAIPMQAVLSGRRCVFEEGAVVYDEPLQDTAREATRKRRTIAGNAQFIKLFPAWLLPWRNPIWFQFVSHKMSRLLSPFLLALLFAANVVLVRDAFYVVLLVGQAAFYALAAVGALARGPGRGPRALGAPLVFVSLNFTILLALWDACRGRFRAAWTRGYGA
ncbi:MAG: glycosyltransferase family 2 protein [Kiritimatiellae bacterium]|nr:glycosyltransferase family 2 protein [Kiritimatiellia bacterium]